MRGTTKTTKELIDDMLSKDPKRIWCASCEIISLGQNHDRIMELVPYLSQIKSKTNNVELGGLIHPNSRFLKQAIETIEWHMKEKSCPCCLLGESSNPIQLEADEYITITDTVYINKSNYVDYYLVRCNRCETKYKVEEREYHSTWWNWVQCGTEFA